MTNDVRYYYGFRQTTPKPPTQWILCGGERSHDEMKAEHANSNVWDCELSPLFASPSREEAQHRIDAMNAGASKSRK